MAARQGTATHSRAAAVGSAATRPGGSRLALFDLDRTLLRGSSMAAFGRALVAEGIVPRRRLLFTAAREARYRWRGASDHCVDRTRARALDAIAGMERESLLAMAGTVGVALVARVAPGARLLIDRHLAAGDRCALLSASPHELVEVIAFELGAEIAIGTRTAVRDGRLTGELDGPFCYGPGKLARLRDVLGPIALHDAWAYADSRSDLPLLQASGHPVAVNPDRALRRMARERGWPVVVLP